MINFCESSDVYTSARTTILMEVVVVEHAQLLKEDEREHCVRPQSGIVGREAFPQREEALLSDELHQDILCKGKRGEVRGRGKGRGKE